MSDSRKPELNNEHRFMALLALTSQRLPDIRFTDDPNGGGMSSQSSNTANAFDQLDADPAALESFLRRHRALSSPPRASAFNRFMSSLAELFEPRAVRFATVASVAALAALLILQTTQWSSAPALRERIEQSYAVIRFDPAQSPLNELVFPWERPPSAVAFAPGATNQALANTQFAQGLLEGRHRLAAMSGAAGQDRSGGDSVYAALGEWNVVLWAIGESRQPQPVEFWRSQMQLNDAFAAAAYDEFAAPRIEAHLAVVRNLLAALGNGENPARNARALADELLLFREQFAPHQPSTP